MTEEKETKKKKRPRWPADTQQTKLLKGLNGLDAPPKLRTIEQACKAAIEAWIASLPSELQKPAMDETILTGGFIANLLLGLKPNDVDLYFKTPEFAFEVAKHYVKQWIERHDGKFESWRISKIEARMVKPREGGKQFTPRVTVFVKSAGVLTDKSVQAAKRVLEDGDETLAYCANCGHAESWHEAIDMSDDPDVADLHYGPCTHGVCTCKAWLQAPTEAVPDYEYFEGVSDPEAANEYLEQILEPFPPAENNFEVACMTSNAISLDHADPYLLNFQLIIRFQGCPEDIHKNFDFAHCTCYYTLPGGLVTPPAALQALLTKELIYIGTLYPFATLIRAHKFVERGFKRPHAGYLLQLAFQLSKLDWNDYNVWREQLLGMDAAYFLEVLHKIGEKRNADGQLKDITDTYLAELIQQVM